MNSDNIDSFIAEAKNTWQRRFGERNIPDDFLCSIKDKANLYDEIA